MWIKRYSGAGDLNDMPTAIAIGANSATVFITGKSVVAGTYNYITIVYSATTGAALWTKRYKGPSNVGDEASALTVSPDGTKVYVTGNSDGGQFGRADYLTIVYSATTGAALWSQRYGSTLGGDYGGSDFATAIAVSADGAKVFVTGSSTLNTDDTDYATVAYNASTGAPLWTKRYNGVVINGFTSDDIPVVLAVAANKVFVTGSSITSLSDWTTLAYSTT